MPKKQPKQIEFQFYKYLGLFLQQERKRIYKEFKPLTRKFLDFNNPENPTAYLRKPQFEALEMYVFLKEYCDNSHLSKIFDNWFNKQGYFEGREIAGIDRDGQRTLFSPFELDSSDDKELYKAVFKQIEEFKQVYPNYIFALTMGLGKTVLIAASIFYEFLLANKYPADEKYCHNALVFAPDKTVLQSLKEIETFDKSKVVPPEYANFIESIKFYFLDDSGTTLNNIENSMFNIIISNTQKIILKRQSKPNTIVDNLFKTKDSRIFSLGNELGIDDDDSLFTNQRFEKLRRTPQLGIYVDEAHHVFGNALRDDFDTRKATSLRNTINMLAESFEKSGTHIVACYNYTGTPYVGSRLLPEVVYAYGLKEAIDKKFLKRVKISGFENIKDQTLAFIRVAITEFWQKYNGKKFENLLPKIAFFASTIEELQTELKPAVEEILTELNIPASKILVNVGDTTITTNDDLREFKNLDSPLSEKQFILLVNKGKEGWNCRSLFAVGLHRQPKSKIFVLQATMRCLRSITDIQETGLVFLSEENISILDAELQENFRLSVDELNDSGDTKPTIEVRLVPPPVKVKLTQVRKLHQMKEKTINEGIDFEFEKADTERYKIYRTERSIINLSVKIGSTKDVTEIKDKFHYSEIVMVAEIARYLNTSPLKIKQTLQHSVQGIETVLSKANEFNELLYDWIIPKLFNYFYEIREYTAHDEVEVELVKEPTEKYYRVKANPELLASLTDERYLPFKDKSFHLDNYCFDSHPESNIFYNLLQDDRVKKVWFTGMLTHGQSDFVIRYIDHSSHTLRSYYPDFLLLLQDGTYIIMEIKADHLIDDQVVKAKQEYATQLATASKMQYQIIKSSDISKEYKINI